MMNANDAKKVIDGLTNQLCVCSNNFIETNGYVIITKERYNKCESALEKQTPKKPLEDTVNHGINISGEYDIEYNLLCPNCETVVGDFEDEKLYYDFCPVCGQALGGVKNDNN